MNGETQRPTPTRSEAEMKADIANYSREKLIEEFYLAQRYIHDHPDANEGQRRWLEVLRVEMGRRNR